MLGIKSQMGRNLGHKTLAFNNMGHQREPEIKLAPSRTQNTANPKINNTFNNSISNRQPIKKYI